jgi:hypothetical protein
MMHHLRPFQIGALCLLLASCAVPKSGSVNEVSPDDIPFGLSSPETSAPSTTTTIVVQTTVAGTAYEKADLFFIEAASLIRVQIEIPSPTNLQGVFTALISGLPSSAPSKAKTLLPTAFAANIDVEGGVANVNSKIGYLDSIKPNEQRLAIAQIVLTLTSQPGIGQVTFSVGGKPIGVPRGRGDIAGAGIPVTFDDYKMLIAK